MLDSIGRMARSVEKAFHVADGGGVVRDREFLHAVSSRLRGRSSNQHLLAFNMWKIQKTFVTFCVSLNDFLVECIVQILSCATLDWQFL